MINRNKDINRLKTIFFIKREKLSDKEEHFFVFSLTLNCNCLSSNILTFNANAEGDHRNPKNTTLTLIFFT